MPSQIAMRRADQVREALYRIGQELDDMASRVEPIRLSEIQKVSSRLVVVYANLQLDARGVLDDRPRTKRRRDHGRCPECFLYGTDCHCHRKRRGRLL
jgi:hypothetical protein